MQADESEPGRIDEEARREYERAWSGGRPAPIESFLPPTSHADHLATLEELVAIELEFGWKAWGEQRPGAKRPARVEEYLLRFERLREGAVLMRLLREEFLVRHRYGDRPQREEYCERFPALVDTPERMGTLPLWEGAERGSHSGAPGTLPQVPGYEITDTLGRGAMGIVYRARQLDLDRPVALKMLVAGAHAGEEELARFHVEAEAAARLRHPNVVQIWEIGTHDGCPYLSLEYVEGGNLADRLGGKPLPPREAARLVEILAGAVHRAHEGGIVHRDLKPENILLSADGTPKIGDFGLAKWLEGAPGSTPVRTRTGDIMGTPGYMSPEQAAGKAKEVGPAADIWALGSILYEAMIGHAPFRAETPWDSVALLMTEEPISPRRVRPSVPTDLDTICLKCLEKDPAKRYATSADLAVDLGRFLRGESILARPTGAWGRSTKWVKRKPLAAALIFVIVSAGLSLLTGSLWYNEKLSDALEREKEQLEETERQREWARANLGKARGAVDRMLTRVAEGPLAKTPRMEQVSRQLLEDALEFYQGFLAQESDSEEIRRDTARAYRRVGDIHMKLGGSEPSEKAYREGIAMQEELVEEFPDRSDLATDLADSLNNVGLLLAATGRHEAAETAFRRAITISNELVERFGARGEILLRLGEFHHGLGTFFSDRGRSDEAEVELRRGLEILERLASPDAAAVLRKQLARTSANLGLLLRNFERFDEAEPLLRRAATLQSELVAEFPEVPEYRAGLGSTYNTLGILLADRRRASEADEAYGKALEYGRSLAADFPSVVDYQSAVGITLHNRAELAIRAADHRRAVELLDDAIRYQLAAHRARATEAAYRFNLRNHHSALGESLVEIGHHRRAAEVARRLPTFLPDSASAHRLAAGFLAQCIGLARKDGALSADDRDAAMRDYAADAVAMLRAAAERGKADMLDWMVAADLGSLRAREEFKAFIAERMKRGAGGD